MESSEPTPTLPDRTADAEDHFLDQVREAPTDELVAWVRLAIEARRPQLAGRLFQLVDDVIDPEPGSPLDKAARVARMWLFEKETPSDRSWSELDDAWEQVHKARYRRTKQKQRDRHEGTPGRIGRLDRRRR